MTVRLQRRTASSVTAESITSRVTVGLEWDACATRLSRHHGRFLGRGEVAIDLEHPGTHCTKRNTMVPPPLLMPSPGLCPAPMMTAIFPVERIRA
jgi:hypothetical protein